MSTKRPGGGGSEPDDWFIDPDVTTDLGDQLADPLDGTQRFTLPERPRSPSKRRGKPSSRDRTEAKPPRGRERSSRGRTDRDRGDAKAPRERNRRERPRPTADERPPPSLPPTRGFGSEDQTFVGGRLPDARDSLDAYDHDLPRVPTRKQRRPAWQRIGFLVGGLALLLVVAAGAVRLIYDGRALPGTTIGSLDVGGKSPDEIRAALGKTTDPERRIVLKGAGEEIRVSAGGAGLQPDVPATTDAALEAGRGWFMAPLGALVSGREVDLVATIDSAALRGSIARVAGEIDRKPYAGALKIDPQSLAVTTSASAEGREVDRAELSSLLQRELLAPTNRTLEIPIEVTNAVSEARVAEVAEDAQKYLETTLKATGAGKDYDVTPDSLAKILQLEPLDGGRKAQLGVDPDATALLAKRIAAARDRSARNASLSAPSTGPRVDGKGEVSWRPRKAEVTVIGEARNGLAIDQQKLAGRIRNAVRDGKHEVKVPAKVTKPAVSAEQAKKVDSLIGTFSTAYEAGQPRVTNIQRIARSVDRTVIGPGQQFSLNGISGERTKAKGYVEAPFIAENRIEPSVGGGVSQFSTTMYNAAYFAGLKIDAFRPHSLFIDRYPPGRESTLNFPDIDMRWTNDTGAPILIRTAADDAGVTVTLYGDNGGRRVTASPGARQPNPGGNFKITVTRTIRYPDGRVVEQPTTTSYANENKTPAATTPQE